MAETLPGHCFVIKQGTNVVRPFFYGTVSQTVAVSISKNGATFASAAGVVSEIGGAGNGLGWYSIALTSVDTSTTGLLAYHATAASGGPADFADFVQSQVFTDLSLNASGQTLIASSIKQNAALNGFTFVMTDSTTHAPKTGLIVTAQRSLGGAGFSLCANSVSELSNGVYSINLAATDTNSPTVMLRFTAANADDQDILLITQP